MSLTFYLYKDVDCGNDNTRRAYVYENNITHNLGKMATASGLYHLLWKPNENEFFLAKDLIEGLEKGIYTLKQTPRHFTQFEPSNGWGNYNNLLDFATSVHIACTEYPELRIEASR